MRISYTIFLISLALIISCGKKSDEEKRAEEGGVTGVEVTTESGLKYIDEKIGTGVTPQSGQTVSVHYTGRLEDGTKFDSSVDRGKPFSFVIGVGRVIRGWDVRCNDHESRGETEANYSLRSRIWS